MELTSHFNATIAENEDIILDGETTRVAVQLRYGLNDDWTVGLEVPWIRHSGGFLDGLIIDWHDFWGLPQNGRDMALKDRLLFRYRRKDQTLLNLDSAAEGIGDIVVSMQRLLNSGRSNRIALHTQMKLPTGEAAKLTGSGQWTPAQGSSCAGDGTKAGIQVSAPAWRIWVMVTCCRT